MGETPSQPGHFLVLREQGDKELSTSLSGEDSWCHHICKYPFPLPGEPGSPAAKPGEWDHIIWAWCSGESPRSMSCSQLSSPAHASNRATVREVAKSTHVRRGETSWGWHGSYIIPKGPLISRPSHLFIPVGSSLRNLHQGICNLLLLLYVKRNILGLSRPALLFFHPWQAQPGG